ncbi:TolB family protein, partial [candidate division KSB1 bacterium]
MAYAGNELVARWRQNQDALTIIDVESKKTTQYKFGIDGVFDADWSPDGEEIAFTGTHNGAADIYTFHIESGNVRKITNDYFSDKSPSWSPDGTRLLFVSDRKQYMDIEVEGQHTQDGNGYNGSPDETEPPYFNMNEHNYKTEDIYIINSDGTGLERLTTDTANDGFPLWSPDGIKMLYTSESNGISNVYIMDIETRDSYPITSA